MMRWRKRTDDARRTKGDPPPTVEQLLAQTKQQGDIIRSLRSQVDGLIAENARLRGRSLPGDDPGKAGHPMPQLTLDPPRPRALWTCPVEGHTDIEWRGNVATCMTCGKQSIDPDVTRPYIIPDYGIPALNDPTVDPDAWKGELR